MGFEQLLECSVAVGIFLVSLKFLDNPYSEWNLHLGGVKTAKPLTQKIL